MSRGTPTNIASIQRAPVSQPTKLNYSRSPQKVDLLRSLTGVLNTNLVQKGYKSGERGKNPLYKTLMMQSELGLGLKNFRFRLLPNIDVDVAVAQMVGELRGVLWRLPRMTRKRFLAGRFVLTFMLLILFKDVFVLSEYFNKLFYRTKFYFQRRLFYNFRKMLPSIFNICSAYALIKGIYLSFKGKVASRGGQRKRVLRMYSGVYTSSNFGIQHKYKFKQI